MAKTGRPREKEGDRKLTAVRLPEDVALQLQHYALSQKKSLSDILAGLVLEWWQENPEREKYEQVVDLLKQSTETQVTPKKAKTGKAA